MGQDKQERAVRQRPLSETEDPPISAGEIAEWLEIFGPEPEIKERPQPSRPSSQPSLKKASKPKPKPRRSLQELKRTDKKLGEDELAEWLDLFGSD